MKHGSGFSAILDLNMYNITEAIGYPVDDAEDIPPAAYARRRSRAVLYHLSGHYKQENIKSKLKLNNVSTG